MNDLLQETDYINFDIDTIFNNYCEWENNKIQNIMTYRDFAHRSAITGNMSEIYPIPWLQAMDDSLSTYLNAFK